MSGRDAMSKTFKSIVFETLPDSEQYYDTIEALKDLDRQYQHFTRTIWKAQKQLLKFDEINRLVAQELEEQEPKEPKAASGRSSGFRSTSKKSSTTPKSSSTRTRASAADVPLPDRFDATLPLHFTMKDVLFNWDNLSWEDIMAKLVAGVCALSGGIIGAVAGGLAGGLPGMVLGATIGLVLGCILDDAIFNFDGELDPEELKKSLLAILLPVVGGLGGLVVGGPVGAAIGLVFGLALAFKVAGLDVQDVLTRISEFFTDLNENWGRRWESFRRMTSELWTNLKTWWGGLSLGSFSFRLPHLTVSWQELSADSILAKYLGITAIPHLGVEWYARGGIVDGATLIGAGEQGKEAIVPLERHTEWIRLVAVQLREELMRLSPAPANLIRMIPATAASLTPYAATLAPQPAAEVPDLSGLADTIDRAIAQLGDRRQPDQDIRVYLDGKQLSDAVTRYQRRSSRANGI